MRAVLWLGGLFNFGAAAMLAFPASLGQAVALPPPGSLCYSSMLALFVGLFGGVYLWLACKPQIDRPWSSRSSAGWGCLQWRWAAGNSVSSRAAGCSPQSAISPSVSSSSGGYGETCADSSSASGARERSKTRSPGSIPAPACGRQTQVAHHRVRGAWHSSMRVRCPQIRLGKQVALCDCLSAADEAAPGRAWRAVAGIQDWGCRLRASWRIPGRCSGDWHRYCK